MPLDLPFSFFFTALTSNYLFRRLACDLLPPLLPCPSPASGASSSRALFLGEVVPSPLLVWCPPGTAILSAGLTGGTGPWNSEAQHDFRFHRGTRAERALAVHRFRWDREFVFAWFGFTPVSCTFFLE